jgi:hypothetical protein
VIRRDRVAEAQQAVGILYTTRPRWIHSHAFKERRLTDVGGIGIPSVNFCGWNYQFVPHWIAFRDWLISTFEHIGQDIGMHNLWFASSTSTIRITIYKFYWQQECSFIAKLKLVCAKVQMWMLSLFNLRTCLWNFLGRWPDIPKEN